MNRIRHILFGSIRFDAWDLWTLVYLFTEQLGVCVCVWELFVCSSL